MNDREIIKNLAYQVIKLVDIIDLITKKRVKNYVRKCFK